MNIRPTKLNTQVINQAVDVYIELANECKRLRDSNASMLAALVSVDKQIEALIGEENWYASSQAANLCREVRAAIAKATGAGKGVGL